MAYSNAKQTKLIKDTAVELFTKNGYENVSVNDICSAAGIARSTFYLSYSSKKDIITQMLTGVRLNKEEYFESFVAAENEFERMWILCCRYLDVALINGPEVTGALFRLDLMGEIDIMNEVHTVDDWFIKLTKNCQKLGVILSTEPAEMLAPLGVDIAYYTTAEWCRNKGSFNLKQVVRRRAEAVYGISPDCRMSEEQWSKLK